MACAFCGSGRYQPQSGQTNCAACAVGKSRSSSAADQPESIACSNCDNGKYQDQESQLVCKPWTQCPAGKFIAADGTTATNIDCAACQTGKYQSNSGIDACVFCAAGKYRNENPASSPEATACSKCSDSSYQPQLGQTACIECGPGKYRNLAVEASSSEPLACISQCGPGTRTVLSANQHSCAQCEQGKYQDQTGMSTCKLCDLGKYSDQSSATGCKTCSLGKFADQIGQAVCKSCPTGQMAYSAGRTSVTDACKPCGQGEIRHNIAMNPMYCCPCTVFNEQLQIISQQRFDCRLNEFLPFPLSNDNSERTTCPLPPTPPPTPAPAPASGGVSTGNTIAYAGIGVAALGAAARAYSAFS